MTIVKQQMSEKTKRAEKIRKRSEESISNSKKTKKSSSTHMADTIEESTATSDQEIDNKIFVEDAKVRMSNIQAAQIDKIIAESMAKHMVIWQGAIMDTFLEKCSQLVDSAKAKTDEKISKIEDKAEEQEKRIVTLETIADDFEQTKRVNNIIVRGLLPKANTKESVMNMIISGLGINVTESDIKYSIKLELKNEKPGTESMRVAFYDTRLRDDVYARRIRLKGTTVYISEDLTMKRSSLAFEAREYARKTQNCTTWTQQGTVFMKDSIEGKPRAIHKTTDILQAPPTDPNISRPPRNY